MARQITNEPWSSMQRSKKKKKKERSVLKNSLTTPALLEMSGSAIPRPHGTAESLPGVVPAREESRRDSRRPLGLAPGGRDSADLGMAHLNWCSPNTRSTWPKWRYSWAPSCTNCPYKRQGPGSSIDAVHKNGIGVMVNPVRELA